MSLLLCGVDLPIALLLGGIATATAPAATYDVVRENRARGEIVDNLLSIVAIDDLWGLLVFTILAVLAGTLVGDASLMKRPMASSSAMLWKLAKSRESRSSVSDISRASP